MRIEIMDTTLRDGEQTPGVAFSPSEKFNIARILLEDVKVDRIEIASARVSKGELEAVAKLAAWCKEKGYLDRLEVLGFVDGTKTIDWLQKTQCRVLNLLCKGSYEHVRTQLRKTPDEHIADIRQVIDLAASHGIQVNVYLEVWSSGMRQSPEYVFNFIEQLQNAPIKRFMLPDTLGILNPKETYDYISQITSRFPDLHFDFHPHNDYGLALANCMSAIHAGARGLHTTVNSLGERTGNVALSSVIGLINDHMKDYEISAQESNIYKIARLVEAFSGIRIPPNMPIIGENVFTQTSGIHADGDNKGNLYFNDLIPERFGRNRQYALGKSSGKASVLKNLQELGIELNPEDLAKVTEWIVEMGDKKETITQDELPFIIAEVIGSKPVQERIKIENYYMCHALNLSPIATLSINIDGQVYEETSTGDGQYDAFMKALNKIFDRLNIQLPALIDYVVTIPPGGQTSALVETVITWKLDREFKTKGLDSDQAASAIKATIRMLNLLDLPI